MSKLKLNVITMAMVLALVAAIGFVTPALAAPIGPDQARVAKFWIGKKYYEVDGQRREIDVAPYIKDGRTMMPVRYLAYSLGIPDVDIKWNDTAKQVEIKRATEKIGMTIGVKSFSMNGYPHINDFDVPPELKSGRTMLPYRVIAQAMGALVFWVPEEQAVIVETFRDVPDVIKQTIKKVTVYKDNSYADVEGLDGSKKRINTDSPVLITDPRDGGFTLNALEWLTIWGVPDEAILFDPVRGGLMVRATTGDYPKMASGYVYLYAGEKTCWNNFYMNSVDKKGMVSGANYIKDNNMYSDNPIQFATSFIFAKTYSWKDIGNYDTSTGWLEN
ncbi:hypothetical protein DCCM_2973 [Desulfocucumis palustris]|uniref:Copper amine oxidase-like N-terminal domain-containing protein n=1 Tax=Desulfocucumis palustris TaxID=1898651 RepID=A0A2L2XCL7_9FIRM|nr:stalk domain-containing protein [Desulfocucumis palustris]GBF33862.1 hypothetical protein DCCM_2973 [Desulfocucumis palustris]